MATKHKSINLLPKEKLDQNLFGKVLNWALTIGRYIIITTELVVIIAFFWRFRYDLQLNKIRESIGNKQEQISSYQKLEKQFRFLQNRIGALNEIKKNNVLGSSVYQEVSQVTPQDVYYYTFNIDANSLSLKGMAMSDVGLISLLEYLKRSPNINQISLDSLSSGGERDPKLEFSLSAKIKAINQL